MPRKAKDAERFQEYASIPAQGARVDTDAGVIHDVKVLGTTSKNGRVYPPATVAAAIPLYEAAKVFVDHGEEGKSRSYRDRIATLKNVRSGPDGLTADLHVNKKHALAEQLFYDAAHSPESVGLSHDVVGKTTRKDGKLIVEAITSVASVDLVTTPATVSSLYEEEQHALENDPELARFAEGCLSAIDSARSLLFQAETPLETKKARLSEILATWQAEVSGGTQQNKSIKEEHVMDWKDVTEQSLRENCPELVAKLTGTDEMSKLTEQVATKDGEIKTLKESLDAKDAEIAAAKAAQAEAAKQVAIQEELKAAKLDTGNKAVCSDVFMEQLRTAADVDARKRLIEDRVALFKAAPKSPVSTGSPFTPVTDVTRPKQDNLSRWLDS